MASAEQTVYAASADGVCEFCDGTIYRGGARHVIEADAMDCLERWTFARFMPGYGLALGFESGQPYSDYGQYGEPYGGVMVFEPGEDPRRWSLVARIYRARRSGERYALEDAVWHPRGVLAWVEDGSLRVHVAEPPGPGYKFDCRCEGAGLAIDEQGRFLRASSAHGRAEFDLERRLAWFDGGPWEPLAVTACDREGDLWERES